MLWRQKYSLWINKVPIPPCLYFCTSILVLRSVWRFLNVARLMQEQKNWNCSERCSELLPASWTDSLSLDNTLRMGKFGPFAGSSQRWTISLCLITVSVTNFPPLFYIPLCIHPNLEGTWVWLWFWMPCTSTSNFHMSSLWQAVG